MGNSNAGTRSPFTTRAENERIMRRSKTPKRKSSTGSNRSRRSVGSNRSDRSQRKPHSSAAIRKRLHQRSQKRKAAKQDEDFPEPKRTDLIGARSPSFGVRSPSVTRSSSAVRSHIRRSIIPQTPSSTTRIATRKPNGKKLPLKARLLGYNTRLQSQKADELNEYNATLKEINRHDTLISPRKRDRPTGDDFFELAHFLHTVERDLDRAELWYGRAYLQQRRDKRVFDYINILYEKCNLLQAEIASAKATDVQNFERKFSTSIITIMELYDAMTRSNPGDTRNLDISKLTELFSYWDKTFGDDFSETQKLDILSTIQTFFITLCEWHESREFYLFYSEFLLRAYEPVSRDENLANALILCAVYFQNPALDGDITSTEDLMQAKELYLKATQVFPSAQRNFEFASFLHRTMKDLEGAEACYAKGMELDKSNQALFSYMELLDGKIKSLTPGAKGDFEKTNSLGLLVLKSVQIFFYLTQFHLPEHVRFKMFSLIDTYVLWKSLVLEIAENHGNLPNLSDDDRLNRLIDAFTTLGESYASSEYHWQFGKFLEKVCEQPLEAEKHYKDSIRVSPMDYEGWHLLGKLLFTNGRCMEGMKCYRKVWELNENFSPLESNDELELQTYQQGVEDAQCAMKDNWAARLWWTRNRVPGLKKGDSAEKQDHSDPAMKLEVFALLLRLKMWEILRREELAYQEHPIDFEEVSFTVPIGDREGMVQFVLNCESVQKLELLLNDTKHCAEYCVNEYINHLSSDRKSQDRLWRIFEISVAFELCFLKFLGISNHSSKNYLISQNGAYIRIFNKDLFRDDAFQIPKYVITACLRNWDVDIRPLATKGLKILYKSKLDLKLYALGVAHELHLGDSLGTCLERWIDALDVAAFAEVLDKHRHHIHEVRI